MGCLIIMSWDNNEVVVDNKLMGSVLKIDFRVGLLVMCESCLSFSEEMIV